jgi:hypothetical protein
MRKFVVLLSAAFLASSVMALWLWHELRAERLHTSRLTAQLATPPARMHRDVSEPVIETPPAPAAQQPVDTEPPTARPENPKQVSAQENWHEYQRRLLANPRYLDERRAQRRLELAARREEAMRLLGFTAEEADGVINLWIESEIRSDVRQTSSSDTDLEAIRARIAAEERANLESLQKLLGERKAEQWRNYYSSLGTRSRVNQLQGQLSGVDMLRDDQVEPLISAIHTEVLQMKGEARDFRDSLDWQTDQLKSHQQAQEREIELMIVAQGRIRASTAAILSRAQQEKLDAMLEREIEARRSQQRMQRVYSKIDAANAAPPPN